MKKKNNEMRLIKEQVKYIIYYDDPLLKKVRKFTDSGKLEWSCVSRWWIFNNIFYDLIKKDLRPIVFKIAGYGKRIPAWDFGTEVGPILMQKASEFGLSVYTRYQTGGPAKKLHLEITAICVLNYDEIIRDLEEIKKRYQKRLLTKTEQRKHKNTETKKDLKEAITEINKQLKEYTKEREECRQLNLSSIWWSI